MYITYKLVHVVHSGDGHLVLLLLLHLLLRLVHRQLVKLHGDQVVVVCEGGEKTTSAFYVRVYGGWFLDQP